MSALLGKHCWSPAPSLNAPHPEESNGQAWEEDEGEAAESYVVRPVARCSARGLSGAGSIHINHPTEQAADHTTEPTQS